MASLARCNWSLERAAKVLPVYSVLFFLLSVAMLNAAMADTAGADDKVEAEGAANSDADIDCRNGMMQILGKVDDPELKINLIDLGVVQKVECNTVDKAASVVIILTSPLCPYIKELVADIKSSLAPVLPKYTINVVVDTKTRWTPSRMSDQAKKSLLGIQQ